MRTRIHLLLKFLRLFHTNINARAFLNPNFSLSHTRDFFYSRANLYQKKKNKKKKSVKKSILIK